MKTGFTMEEMVSAIAELRKVWNYEKTVYDEKFLTEEDKKNLDEKTVSYGISLGVLRKIFMEHENT